MQLSTTKINVDFFSFIDKLKKERKEVGVQPFETRSFCRVLRIKILSSSFFKGFFSSTPCEQNEMYRTTNIRFNTKNEYTFLTLLTFQQNSLFAHKTSFHITLFRTWKDYHHWCIIVVHPLGKLFFIFLS